MTRKEQIKEAAQNELRKYPNLFITVPAFEMGAEWADQHPHWISIEDSLSKEHQWFLGYSPIKSAMLVDVYNFDSNGLIEAHCITHWMPLPQPPKKGDEE